MYVEGHRHEATSYALLPNAFTGRVSLVQLPGEEFTHRPVSHFHTNSIPSRQSRQKGGGSLSCMSV